MIHYPVITNFIELHLTVVEKIKFPNYRQIFNIIRTSLFNAILILLAI